MFKRSCLIEKSNANLKLNFVLENMCKYFLTCCKPIWPKYKVSKYFKVSSPDEFALKNVNIASQFTL